MHAHARPGMAYGMVCGNILHKLPAGGQFFLFCDITQFGRAVQSSEGHHKFTLLIVLWQAPSIKDTIAIQGQASKWCLKEKRNLFDIAFALPSPVL